jgi:hypothetical protein
MLVFPNATHEYLRMTVAMDDIQPLHTTYQRKQGR